MQCGGGVWRWGEVRMTLADAEVWDKGLRYFFFVRLTLLYSLCSFPSLGNGCGPKGPFIVWCLRLHPLGSEGLLFRLWVLLFPSFFSLLRGTFAWDKRQTMHLVLRCGSCDTRVYRTYALHVVVATYVFITLMPFMWRLRHTCLSHLCPSCGSWFTVEQGGVWGRVCITVLHGLPSLTFQVCCALTLFMTVATAAEPAFLFSPSRCELLMPFTVCPVYVCACVCVCAGTLLERLWLLRSHSLSG